MCLCSCECECIGSALTTSPLICVIFCALLSRTLPRAAFSCASMLHPSNIHIQVVACLQEELLKAQMLATTMDALFRKEDPHKTIVPDVGLLLERTDGNGDEIYGRIDSN
jgi:hypothetical protein